MLVYYWSMMNKNMNKLPNKRSLVFAIALLLSVCATPSGSVFVSAQHIGPVALSTLASAPAPASAPASNDAGIAPASDAV